ncbi:FAD-binding oxidoreductase [Dactylosporangium sp. AC04546]|uniref:FAD-binding oxidoreductase n=1 Tax=Dactylosporangium sp. AC04546 TaxID=2862460 RepID=UPI001EE039A6|nr:FAD-binding oxidoreductase [Dactylosporangium sp. AC04546]WVK83379.1 FAD-binding oxidoreductase [Dactylosporangium sp. AC04546]
MTISDISIDDLTATVAGPVFVPGDEAYAAETFAWNVAHQHKPLVVVGATSAADVAAAVRWAGQHGLAVAVQATGHGAVRPAESCVLVSTTRMQQLSVDPATRTARAAAGVRWAQVIEAAAPHGLAPLNGSSSNVGVVGYTLGGGMGPLGRTFGFAADHVRSVEIVTADGAVRTIDADREADLFWAVRGGKGNFGIVTAIEFGLVEVASLYAGGIYFPATHAAEVLHRYREWAPTLPERTNTSIAALRLPPLPQLPEPLRGAYVVHLRFAHLGPAEEGAELLAPMRAVAPALIDAVGELPYQAIDAVHQDPVDPMPSRERGALLGDLSAETIDRLLEVAGPQVADIPVIMVELRLMGGALSRPAAVPNAVSGRGAAYSLFVIGLGVPELAPVVDAVSAGIVAAAAADTVPGGLVNFSGSAVHEELLANWSQPDRDRLLRIKRSYDPTNLFSANQALLP